AAPLAHPRSLYPRFAGALEPADHRVRWIGDNLGLDVGHPGFIDAHIPHASQVRRQSEDRHAVIYYIVVDTSMYEHCQNLEGPGRTPEAVTDKDRAPRLRRAANALRDQSELSAPHL